MLACSGRGAAQQVAPSPTRSTLDGVFTSGQATAGRKLYGLRCKSCHTPEGHSATIKAKWNGRLLSELFQYISENMPKDNPGGLEPDEDVQALAYLLQTTGMPAGNDALAADEAALSAIRFDTLGTREAKP